MLPFLTCEGSRLPLANRAFSTACRSWRHQAACRSWRIVRLHRLQKLAPSGRLQKLANRAFSTMAEPVLLANRAFSTM